MIGKQINVSRWTRALDIEDTVILGLGFVLAIALRWSMRNYASEDFRAYTNGWYKAIKLQGFSVFGSNFANYTPPYLYLLYGVSVLFHRLAPVIAVKLPALVCDFICGWFVYRLVRLKYDRREVPLLAFFATIFAPTVVLNSAMWGQADSIYTTALVACVYFLATERPAYAWVAFGVAFAFKLQAIFLAPLLLALLLRRQVAWKYVLLVPLVYLIAIVPAGLAGRPWRELLLIYANQSEAYRELTMGAPNMYTWLPNERYDALYGPGLIWAVIMCFLFVVLVYKSEISITHTTLVQLALLSVLLVPYVTPKMHERYFFPADVLSIVWGFYLPKYFWVPLVIGLTSFFVYTPYLLSLPNFIPHPVLALGLFIIIVVVCWRATRALYSQKA
ncbi:MAG: glycosyltransferase family 39 protein [Herpetosiphonaceae bacterium]|nr:glycosyltransferase family 39 protein [Herpetosiphonaceae bacterium]